MTLNERFTTLLKNAGSRPLSSRPSGWQRPPAARYLRRQAGAVIARGRELLLIHRDSPLEGAFGTGAPRTVLKGGSWTSPPRRLRSPAQRLDMMGPHRRAHMGGRGRGRGQGPGRGRGRGRGRGQGISPLNRPQLTKEQLDQELDAYMALYNAKERLDADLEADMEQPVPDQEDLDDDLDATMADAGPETPTQNDS